MNPTLKAWLKQPTTVHGIGALIGVIAAFVTYHMTHDAMTAATVAGSAFGVVCMAMGDNTGDKSSVEQLATDAIQAIVSQRVGAMIPTLGADVIKVLQTTAAPVAVVTPVVAPAPAAPAPAAP